jgi:hypothetical protein
MQFTIDFYNSGTTIGLAVAVAFVVLGLAIKGKHKG